MPVPATSPSLAPKATKSSISPEVVIRICDKYQGTRGALIAILEDVQATYNYLPREALKIVSKRTGTSMVDIYGVATFYKVFSLQP